MVEAHFDEQTYAEADTVRMPPVTDLPDLPAAAYASDAAHDFDEALRSEKAGPEGQAARDNDPWTTWKN